MKKRSRLNKYLEFIQKNPGVGLTALRDEFSVHRTGFSGASAKAAVMNNVYQLQAKGLVRIEWDGKEKKFFSVG